MVARRSLGLSKSNAVVFSRLLSLAFSSLISLGSKEKKATSDPDISPELANRTIIPINSNTMFMDIGFIKENNMNRLSDGGSIYCLAVINLKR